MSDPLEASVKNAIANSGVPQIYCNGFSVTVTPVDVIMVAKRADETVGVLYMSHNLAKTIVDLLGTSLAKLEAVTGAPILTTREIGDKMGLEEQEDADQ